MTSLYIKIKSLEEAFHKTAKMERHRELAALLDIARNAEDLACRAETERRYSIVDRSYALRRKALVRGVTL